MEKYLKLTQEEFEKAKKVLQEAGIGYQDDVSLIQEVILQRCRAFTEDRKDEVDYLLAQNYPNLDKSIFERYLVEEIEHILSATKSEFSYLDKGIANIAYDAAESMFFTMVKRETDSYIDDIAVKLKVIHTNSKHPGKYEEFQHSLSTAVLNLIVDRDGELFKGKESIQEAIDSILGINIFSASQTD